MLVSAIRKLLNKDLRYIPEVFWPLYDEFNVWRGASDEPKNAAALRQWAIAIKDVPERYFIDEETMEMVISHGLAEIVGRGNERSIIKGFQQPKKFAPILFSYTAYVVLGAETLPS